MTIAALLPLDCAELLERTFGRPDFAKKILDLFLEQVAASRQELAAAIEAGDLPGCRHVVHRLKGSSANAAAGALHRLLVELEERLDAGHPLGPDDLQRLDAQSGRLVAWVESDVRPQLARRAT